MAVGLSVSLALLLFFWTSATSHQIPEGVLQMECRDRYFMIAVNLSFTGEDPQFEVVDEGGAHPITESFGAQYGYTISMFPAQGLVELRASYFSLHTFNQDDLVFTFTFNLVVSRDGEDVKLPINKTCSPALAWAPRELTCEANYMEMSVVTDEACPTGTKEEDWDASAKMVYKYATSEWQVAMRKPGQEMIPVNVSEAWRRGYEFHLTEGRLVFRTPYGQPDSFSAQVNGVPVEVVHAILFSRHSWVIITVNLLAHCSMHEGSYENGYLQWRGLQFSSPNKRHKIKVTVGMNGELEQAHPSGVENTVDSGAEQGVYEVEKQNSVFQIGIPYNAEGGRRKSLALDGLYEFYVFNLYVEQILLEGDQVDARLRVFRTLVTPLLPRPLFCENGTLLAERMFLAYLGDVPEDVVLVSVGLNGQEFPLQAQTLTGFTVTEVAHANNTRGYTLKVPFDHPVVQQQFSKQDRAMQYVLMIQFTLHVLPEERPVYHQTSVTVLLDASPPAINASCSDSGIRFTLEHRPSEHPWQITIGSELLTSELAARHGYVLSNHSQRLQLDVPLFTAGYEYKNVSLKGFAGTFEVHLQDPKSAEVHSWVQTCPFSLSQYIFCSRNGVMTVVADLSPMVQSGLDPARTSLLSKDCRPTESDGTRVLYSFPLNSCGNTVKVGKDSVTYQNEIFPHSEFHNEENPLDWVADLKSVVIQCTYPLAGLHRFFWTYKFESETAGVGRILYAAQPHSEELQTSTTQPTTARRKWSLFLRPSYRLPYAKIPNYPNFLFKSYSKRCCHTLWLVFNVSFSEYHRHKIQKEANLSGPGAIGTQERQIVCTKQFKMIWSDKQSLVTMHCRFYYMFL